MQPITKTIRLHREQQAFRKSTAQFRGFVGGRGAGKSWIGAYDLIRRAKPKRLYMMIAPTYPMLMDGSWRTLLDRAQELGVCRYINRSNLIVRLGNGAEILCRSADNPDRLRGPNLSGAWLDEASLMIPDVYSIVIACLREAGEMGWLSATFTPKGRAHWTYDRFGRQAPDTALFRSRTLDNPFNPPEFYRTIQQQYGKSSLASQELEGEFVDNEGQLIRFEWMIQCQDKCLWQAWPAAGARHDLYVGIDVGRSRDRTVIWTWEKVGDVCWCREILVLKDCPFESQMEYIKARITKHVVKCRIDQGLMAMPMVEDLRRRYPGVVEGVSLSQGEQVRLAERMRVAFETRAVRVPDDPVLREDFQLVTIENGSVVTGRKSTVGHADRFWAAALGYDAAHWSVRQPRASTPWAHRPRGF